MTPQKRYESEVGEKATYKIAGKEASDYHTIRYIRWLEAQIKDTPRSPEPTVCICDYDYNGGSRWRDDCIVHGKPKAPKSDDVFRCRYHPHMNNCKHTACQPEGKNDG